MRIAKDRLIAADAVGILTAMESALLSLPGAGMTDDTIDKIWRLIELPQEGRNHCMQSVDPLCRRVLHEAYEMADGDRREFSLPSSTDEEDHEANLEEVRQEFRWLARAIHGLQEKSGWALTFAAETPLDANGTKPDA